MLCASGGADVVVGGGDARGVRRAGRGRGGARGRARAGPPPPAAAAARAGAGPPAGRAGHPARPARGGPR